jgi:hypothetical protein
MIFSLIYADLLVINKFLFRRYIAILQFLLLCHVQPLCFSLIKQWSCEQDVDVDQAFKHKSIDTGVNEIKGSL